MYIPGDTPGPIQWNPARMMLCMYIYASFVNKYSTLLIVVHNSVLLIVSVTRWTLTTRLFRGRKVTDVGWLSHFETEYYIYAINLG